MAATGEEFDVDALADYTPSDDEGDEEKTQKNNTEQTNKPGGQTAFLNTTFRDLLLRPELLRAIVDSGFELPSPVQSKALPAALVGTDILCQAKAGTGKTAIFVLGVLQQLAGVKSISSTKPDTSKDSSSSSSSSKPSSDTAKTPVSCVVLCHNRELAYQIFDEFQRFLKYLSESISCAVFYGGTPVNLDRQRLTTPPFPDIIIGTPGRLLQLVSENTLTLSSLRYFIIDECDQVLSQLDMRSDVQKIFRQTPKEKQVLMFSATLPQPLKAVCSKFMRNPLEIIVNDSKNLVVSTLNQYVVFLKEEEKTRKLLELLDELEFNQVMIFVSGQGRAEALDRLLREQNFPSVSMYGRLEQSERIKRFKEFKEFKSRVMVSTNMLGRGIDVVRVNVVVNYDMAESVEVYLHRVGRAGRFSTRGLAISFVRKGGGEGEGKEEMEVLEEVRKTCGIPVDELPKKIDPSTYMNQKGGGS